MAKALKKVTKSNSSLAKRYMDEIVGRQMNGFYQVLKMERAVTKGSATFSVKKKVKVLD